MMQSSWLCFFVFACTCIAPAFSSSSADDIYSTLSFFTSYYTGGEKLYGKLPKNTRYYNFVRKYARFQILEHCTTNATGLYEFKGYLFIQFPFWYGGDPSQNDHNYHGGSGSKAQGAVKFWLKGLWSEKSRQLMLVGSASWTVEGKPIALDAVLDLNYTVNHNPTLYTGYISGTLKSMVSTNDPGYFDPFSIFSFPSLPDYNYSLLPQALGGVFSSDFDVQENQWPSYEGHKYCWVIMGESIVLELEYAAECRGQHQHCSPLGVGDDGSLPRFMLLTPIQCSAAERKLRYLATFQNTRYDQGFSPNSTVIGEASWDDKKRELFGIACRLLDPLNRSANEVGDCTMRLSLRYTSIFTIRNDPKLVGRFRSTRNVEKFGYFRKINLTNFDGNELVTLPDVIYEYTKLNRVSRTSCTTKKPVNKGNTYPDVHSDNMRLDMSVQNSRGENFAWVYVTPLWVGNDLYQKKNKKEISGPYSNISYMIRLSSSTELEFGYLFDRLNWSTNHYNEVEVTAEGVYSAETGYLCMMGCRKLESSTYTSMDCEILVSVEFALLTGMGGSPTKGTITSTRAKTDPLYFEEMMMYSAVYYGEEAAQTIWRMDMEIVMVLISNTLVCIFVALQIFHVRRNPKVPSFISVFMLLVLSVGHMIPLILNFEAVHLRNHSEERVYLGNGGRLEANEVAIRLSSLVALLLQMRLLQLVWTAKQTNENGERKAGFVLLALYVLGGLFALLVNWTSNKDVYGESSVGAFSKKGRKYSVMSYAGLILDGFLLPQILSNAFRGSVEKALSCPFYIGISAVRLAPHAYDQYREHNYRAFDLKKTYYYANPAIGFYTRACDIMIPFGIIALAVVIFLQQSRGGRLLAFFFET
ncbi:hypothetical protein C2S51_015534 [Perilla frutescens var. frutescens]|nr:hypothetical protein C2S51_015534 [Perilla frutescens var. frutescens]